MRLSICSLIKKCSTHVLHTHQTFSSSFKIRWAVYWERLRRLANWQTERYGSSLIHVATVLMLICVTEEHFLLWFSRIRMIDSRPSLNWQCHPKNWSMSKHSIYVHALHFVERFHSCQAVSNIILHNKPLLHLRFHGEVYCRHIPIITQFGGCFTQLSVQGRMSI